MLASLLRIILLTATLKILERGLDKGPIIKKALLAYIQEKLDDLSKQRAELEKTASQCEIVDIPNAIKELKKQIQQIKKEYRIHSIN